METGIFMGGRRWRPGVPMYDLLDEEVLDRQRAGNRTISPNTMAWAGLTGQGARRTYNSDEIRQIVGDRVVRPRSEAAAVQETVDSGQDVERRMSWPTAPTGEYARFAFGSRPSSVLGGSVRPGPGSVQRADGAWVPGAEAEAMRAPAGPAEAMGLPAATQAGEAAPGMDGVPHGAEVSRTVSTTGEDGTVSKTTAKWVNRPGQRVRQAMEGMPGDLELSRKFGAKLSSPGEMAGARRSVLGIMGEEMGREGAETQARIQYVEGKEKPQVLTDEAGNKVIFFNGQVTKMPAKSARAGEDIVGPDGEVIGYWGEDGKPYYIKKPAEGSDSMKELFYRAFGGGAGAGG